MLTRKLRRGGLKFKSKRQYGKIPKKAKKGKSSRKKSKSVSKKGKKLKGGS